MEQLNIFWNLDLNTILAILFWGTLTILLISLAFFASDDGVRLEPTAFYFVMSKTLFLMAYVLILQGRRIPYFMTVNISGSFLMMAFYFESISILKIGNRLRKRNLYLLTTLTVLFIAIFNVIGLFVHTTSFRAISLTVCVAVVLIVPSILLITDKKISKMSRMTGYVYLVYVLLSLPNGILPYVESNISEEMLHMLQSVSVLMLVLIMITGTMSYFLMLKEKSDIVINKMTEADPVTKVSSRNSFMYLASLTFAENKAEQKITTVLFFDLDHFKNVNDTYGHAFGDTVLKRFGRVLKKNLREEDLICRYGGEEFVALLSGVEQEDAEHMTQRVFDALKNVTFEAHPELQVTASAGIYSDIPDEECDVEDFINKADQALYSAKENGRDRMVVYSEECKIGSHV